MDHLPAHLDRPRALRVGAVVLALAALAAALSPARAGAGLYTAVQCHPAFGAGHDDSSFSRSSADFISGAACAKGAGGLQVTHRRSHTLDRRSGGWAFSAPAGASLVRATARASGTAAGGLQPEIMVRVAGALRRAATAAGKPHRVSWSGAGQALVARLRCSHAPSCAPTNAARLRVNRVRLRLLDQAEPSVTLFGELAEAPVVRGVPQLPVAAGDTGGGVRRISVEVNGHPAGEQASSCSLAGWIALRVSPCPASAAASFGLETTTAPFRQGRNELSACASDYAARKDANVACVTRRFRVDNACPVSAVAGGTRLAAAIGGVRHGHVAGAGEHPRVAGRLLDAAGLPVSGARVCVAARNRLPGAREHVLATPLTGQDGRFSAPIGRGPARRLRVAYWPGQTGAVERFTKLRFRARPKLGLRPRGKLHTGRRLHFDVGLEGPVAARRLVRIEARSNGRWVPVTGGRTGARGAYHGGYRFHATHGRRVYRFRALVPRQAGYPYAPGTSAVKRKVVKG